MEISLKKAARSLQVGGPGLQDLRYLIQRKVLRLFGRAWRPDAEAVWYFGMEVPTIVDIGANRGFRIDSFLLLRPNASIIAFGPTSEFGRNATHPLLGTGERFDTFLRTWKRPGAVGNLSYVPIYRGVRWDALASLKHAEAANWVNSDRFYFFDPSKLRIEEESTVVRTLDSFSLKPDIIKILTQRTSPSSFREARRQSECEPAIMAPARIPSVNESLVKFGVYAIWLSRFRSCAKGRRGTHFLGISSPSTWKSSNARSHGWFDFANMIAGELRVVESVPVEVPAQRPRDGDGDRAEHRSRRAERMRGSETSPAASAGPITPPIAAPLASRRPRLSARR